MLDLQALMENETDDVAFVVIRTVECSEASILMARADGSLRWTEAIYMKSKISKHVMRHIATCYFQPAPPKRDNLGLPSPAKSSNGSIASFEQNRVDPADLFVFHHRQLLRTYLSAHKESKKHIQALLKYIETRCSKKFAEADDLFARGLVTQAHILYLLRPNEIIISGTYGKPAAFVLQEWPVLSIDGWVTLYCWSFQTDGSGFARKRSVLSILPIGSTTKKIQDLVAYPLHYATAEVREFIRSRGKKQWELRTSTQITYKGWNVAKDQFFVSLKSIMFIFTFS